MDRGAETGQQRPKDRALAWVTVAFVIAALATVSIARSSVRAADFGPAVAVAGSEPEPGLAPHAESLRPVRASAIQPLESSETPAGEPGGTLPAPAPSTVPVASTSTAAEPVRVAVAPVLVPRPTAAPAPVAGDTCPATWFCYPRLALAGPIVPYTDCSGSTDVGGSIRSFSCLSDHYLMGHAYTSFGLIRQWIAGDVVYAYGKKFTVSGATTQSACSSPQFPLAALSLQTSLTSRACGEVLVVQAR